MLIIAIFNIALFLNNMAFLLFIISLKVGSFLRSRSFVVYVKK